MARHATPRVLNQLFRSGRGSPSIGMPVYPSLLLGASVGSLRFEASLQLILELEGC